MLTVSSNRMAKFLALSDNMGVCLDGLFGAALGVAFCALEATLTRVSKAAAPIPNWVMVLRSFPPNVESKDSLLEYPDCWLDVSKEDDV